MSEFLNVHELISLLQEIEKEYGEDVPIIQDIGYDSQFLINLRDYNVSVIKNYVDKNNEVSEFPSENRELKPCVHIGTSLYQH